MSRQKAIGYRRATWLEKICSRSAGLVVAYSGGVSEGLVARFIKETGSRDEVVLATKFGFNGSASPLTATRAGGGNPNAGGAGAKNVHRALGASLRRLGTDYVDLY